MKATDFESLNSKKREKSADAVAMSPRHAKNQASSLKNTIYVSDDGKLNPNLDVQVHIMRTTTVNTMMNPYLLDDNYIRGERNI
ncbi:MAG: hypothetical protein QXI36_05020 [Candidatus Bathyarchaeia archaeon]